MPGGMELVLIGAVVLLLFGGKKLPELARSLGKSQKEFKRGLKEGATDEDESTEPTEAKADAKADAKAEARKTEPQRVEDKPES
jgi:sec-independent protein translocase protein TatA